MVYIEPFMPGVGETYDDRILPRDEYTIALASVTRAYHSLVHALAKGVTTLAGGAAAVRADGEFPSLLAAAVARFAASWRTRLLNGPIDFGTIDPVIWLDELVAACDHVDQMYRGLMSACVVDWHWYDDPPRALVRLIRGVDHSELPLLASEVLDINDYAIMLGMDVTEAVACCA
jgi:hypothetical protein